VVGADYLLQNLGLLKWLPGDVLWPLLLILLGAYLLGAPVEALSQTAATYRWWFSPQAAYRISPTAR